jgi:hypothetical protein
MGVVADLTHTHGSQGFQFQTQGWVLFVLLLF